MFQTEGFQVGLPSDGHRLPSMCASCGGPRQTSVVLQTSRRSGQITTILRMKMPYCQTCAARVASAGRRMMGLFALVTIAAAGLPALLPMVLEVSLSPTLLAAAGAGGALVFTGLAALIFLPKKPAAPATARGEAVWVTRFPDGGDLEVFCTNPTFAAGLAEANQKPMHRATRVRWVEIVSVIWCIALSAGMVFLTWNAETSGPLAPAPAASASAAPAKASAPKPTSPAPKPAPKKK